MLKKISVLFFLTSVFFVFGQDFEKIDSLHANGKHKEALSELQSSFDKSNPNPAIIWRIGRGIYEETTEIKNKKEKLARLDEGTKFLEPYYSLKSGSPRDIATIMFWYAVFSSETSRTRGIKDSLDNIPNLFKYCNEAIVVDPTFGDPYYLKAMINDGLPALFGGDKYQMSVDLKKALDLDPSNYTYLVDGAIAHLNRGWDAKKKQSEARKKGASDDGSPSDMSDKEYAKVLIKKAVDIFKNDGDRTLKEKKVIETGMAISEKL